MKHAIECAAVLALLCLSAQPALADFTMEPPASPPPAGKPQVIGGIAVDAADWPASLRFFSGPDNNKKSCTSTVIGSQTILTAAHCVSHGETGEIVVEAFRTTVTCHHHPRYTPSNFSADTAYDIALCFAATSIVLPADGKYERLNTDPSIPKIGDTVELLGYGCQQAGGPVSEYLFWGQAPAVQPTWTNAYIETVGGAAICSGDSGGAAYVSIGNYRRMIVGVNSRSDMSSRSYITASAQKLVLEFIQSWAKARNTKICGLDEEASKCHV